MACRSLFIVGFPKRRQRRLSRSPMGSPSMQNGTLPCRGGARVALAMQFMPTTIAGTAARQERRPNWVCSPSATAGRNVSKTFAYSTAGSRAASRSADRAPGPLARFLHDAIFHQRTRRDACCCGLSGSNGKPPPIAAVGRLLARLQRLRLGQRGHSPLMQALFFGAFNKPFEPARTPFRLALPRQC